MAYSNLYPVTRSNNMGAFSDSSANPSPAKYKYSYVSADTAATGEVAGYFPQTLGLTPGDCLDVVWNVLATPVRKSYVVEIANPVTLAMAVTTLG